MSEGWLIWMIADTEGEAHSENGAIPAGAEAALAAPAILTPGAPVPSRTCAVNLAGLAW